MMKQNWFDTDLGKTLEKATAEQALAEIAKSPRIVKAVEGALAEHDKHAGRPGPSRSQAIRDALAEVLQAD
jgi:hypothetical protein